MMSLISLAIAIVSFYYGIYLPYIASGDSSS